MKGWGGGIGRLLGPGYFLFLNLLRVYQPTKPLMTRSILEGSVMGAGGGFTGGWTGPAGTTGEAGVVGDPTELAGNTLEASAVGAADEDDSEEDDSEEEPSPRRKGGMMGIMAKGSHRGSDESSGMGGGGA